MRGQIGCRVSVEEADNPPASSCRALLPAGVRQTPGTTELGRKRQKDDDLNDTHLSNPNPNPREDCGVCFQAILFSGFSYSSCDELQSGCEVGEIY